MRALISFSTRSAISRSRSDSSSAASVAAASRIDMRTDLVDVAAVDGDAERERA